jgi:release factor glutamine methyltransferase
MPTAEELLRLGVERLREAGSESPRLDAELLLGHAIGTDRTVLIAHPEAVVSDGAAARYEEALVRRCAGEPVAYIRGFKEFHGLALAADPRALIPRPETERIVELAEIEILQRLTAAPRPRGTPPLRVADVGTGGGAIGVSLAVALRRRGVTTDVEILGTDESVDALDLARENAVGHAVGDRVRFIEADLLPPVVATPFEVILANLPYIPTATIPTLPVAASFEPRLALDGGPDGLSLIRRLIERLPDGLADGGVALLEIGSDQADAVEAIVRRDLPGWPVMIELDLGGQPRVARIERAIAGRATARP